VFGFVLVAVCEVERATLLCSQLLAARYVFKLCLDAPNVVLTQIDVSKHYKPLHGSLTIQVFELVFEQCILDVGSPFDF
jgi:hypothetical protein